MGKPNFSDEFKRDAVAQDYRAGISGSKSFVAARGQHTFAVCVEAAIREDSLGRCRQGCRDPAVEARTGPDQRGARHLKKSHRVFRQRCKVRYAFIAEHRDFLEFGRCAAVWPCSPVATMLGGRIR